MRDLLRAVALWHSTNQAVDLWRAYNVVAGFPGIYENWGYDQRRFVWPLTPKDGNESQMSGVNDPDKTVRLSRNRHVDTTADCCRIGDIEPTQGV